MKSLALVCVFVVLALQGASAQATVFLVRHAEKAASGDAKNPDLSDIGQARAKALGKSLKDTGVTAIYATEFKRTQQTAEPLAHAKGVEVTSIPANETATLVSKLKETKGNALVIGHSNTLPEIIKALGVSDSIAIGDNDYDDLFVIINDVTPPKLLHLHYN